VKYADWFSASCYGFARRNSAESLAKFSTDFHVSRLARVSRMLEIVVSRASPDPIRSNQRSLLPDEGRMCQKAGTTKECESYETMSVSSWD